MAIDITSAFTRLQNALEEFHSAVIQFQDAEAPAVLRAVDQLADAYTIYDDAIFTEYGVEAPFDTFSDDEYEDDVDDPDIDEDDYTEDEEDEYSDDEEYEYLDDTDYFSDES
ncbi:hypothetical protein [Arcanobacterium hippocoleae]|uniref:DNA primase n=1 Tax=Arcanobacterium hippocoleae TaxID=149017 RepID=A0ABU1T0K6_9ACTO|nr:hypothetical protein [Arcanobacterium hippocoleae]MDR6938824.1 hypothetical protein [Arcanobacterium hippocoleae]